jgi:shikimate kinase
VAKKTRPAATRGVPANNSLARGVVLIGFMGAGKSSVGRVLAKRLDWNFEDLDERIERLAKCKVYEIFRDLGESEFREIEHRALKKALSGAYRRKKVLALGGGAFVQKENAKLIKASGVPVIFLDAPVRELWRRCRSQAEMRSIERPLLTSFSNFRNLHDVRRPHYLKATFRQSTSSKAVDKIAEGLINILGLRSKTTTGKRGDKH